MLLFVLFNRDMKVNLYKLYYNSLIFHLNQMKKEKNKENSIPSFFHPPNQSQTRETKIFSIISLFHSLPNFYLPTLPYPPNQTNSKTALTRALTIASNLDLER